MKRNEKQGIILVFRKALILSFPKVRWKRDVQPIDQKTANIVVKNKLPIKIRHCGYDILVHQSIVISKQ